jgi:sensor histidine kinase YesM
MDQLNSKKESIRETQDKKLLAENIFLKSKIAYSLGSLETINYLLKNDDPEMLNKNLEHLRGTVNRVLNDLSKDFSQP